MGAREKTLIVSPADWSEVFADLLAPAFTTTDALVAVGAQVVRGEASLFAIDDGGGIVGAFVLRTDGEEGVIVAAAGELDGMSIADAMIGHVEQRFTGVKAIRFHTAVPALARRMTRHGYQFQELVMRKEF